ncbi:MAG: acetate/propionate family kinase [Hyphomicrobiaceae bacterium]
MPANKSILVVNAGSSSIKFAVYGADLAPQVHGELEGIGTLPRLWARCPDGSTVIDRSWYPRDLSDTHALISALTVWLESHLGEGKLAAIGHRVAIGGLSHSAPTLITPEVLDRLRALKALAPLHLPRNLEPIESLARLHPHLPQVACFDTAFHRSMPKVACTYGLPRQFAEAGARRYGFHGLSYEYIARRLSEIQPAAATGRTIVAHLGSGSSLCALRSGRSIATTMGFSPLSGLVMGTRPGELDAGLMIWLIRDRGMSIDQVEHMLYHESGLKGVSGLSSDMRELLANSCSQAREAVELFVYRIAIECGGLVAALGGLDALVFTAGIGERAASIRGAVCERLGWLGVRIDDDANAANAQCISTADSPVSVLVIPTNEELMVAGHTRALALPQTGSLVPNPDKKGTPT